MPHQFARHRWRGLVLALALSLAAFGSASAQFEREVVVRDGPRLILKDSVVLQESDNYYAGRPTHLVLGSDGSFFVVDSYSARVLRFDQSGKPVRAYGRRGRGPGEFLNIMGFASFVHDDILAVADGQPPVNMELEIFEVGSGDHLGRVTLDGVVTALAVDNGRLWAAGMDIEEWRALGSAPLDPLLDFNAPDGSVSGVSLDRVAVPQPYVENRQIMIMGGFAVMDVGEDDVLVTFRTSPYVLRVAHDGAALDTIPLHARERRGVPDDEAFMEMATLSATATLEQINEFHSEMDRSVSLLLQVSRDVRGRILTVHADVERRGDRDFTGVLYVSSLNPDGTMQCSDTLLPVSDAAFPVAILMGSEVVVLDQRIGSGAAGDIRTVVRTFGIDPDRCDGMVEMDER